MKSSKNRIRCAIYIRVSTEEQHLNGLSLPAQRKALTEYAQNAGYVVVDYYADEGISARKSMKHRKDLLRLLEDVKKNKIDMILVTKLDRWFRNIADYNITEEILQAHNCHWKTIFENYDSSTANGQMVINIMLSVNQAECDRTSERIKAVFDYKRSIGEVTSGMCAGYGYKVVNNRLVKDEATADIAEDIFRQYFTCYSIRKTISYITEKYGNASPTAYQISYMLKSETYAGINGKNNNYCEPYISEEQFRKIREVSKSKTYLYHNEPYLFGSMIICPSCKKKLHGFVKRQKLKNGEISEYKRYRCTQKFGYTHSSPCISETVIESYLLQNIFLELQKELCKFDSGHCQKRPSSTTNKLNAELNRLNILFQKGRISEVYYDEQYELIRAKLDELKENTPSITRESYLPIIDALNDGWLDLYNKLDAEHKKSFWKSLIKEIYVSEKTHKICGFKFLL